MTLLGIIGGQELIIILLIVLVLFGAKKIPELMRSFGKGVKEFKDGMNGVQDTDQKAASTDSKNEKTE